MLTAKGANSSDHKPVKVRRKGHKVRAFWWQFPANFGLCICVCDTLQDVSNHKSIIQVCCISKKRIYDLMSVYSYCLADWKKINAICLKGSLFVCRTFLQGNSRVFTSGTGRILTFFSNRYTPCTKKLKSPS